MFSREIQMKWPWNGPRGSHYSRRARISIQEKVPQEKVPGLFSEAENQEKVPGLFSGKGAGFIFRGGNRKC